MVGLFAPFCMVAMASVFLGEGLWALGTQGSASSTKPSASQASARKPATGAASAAISKSVAGAYADPEDPTDVYFALKSDGTFLEGTPDGVLPGKYKVEGDKVAFQIEGAGQPIRYAIQPDGFRQLDYPRIYVRLRFLPEAIAGKLKQTYSENSASAEARAAARLKENERIAVGCLWTIWVAQAILELEPNNIARSLNELGPAPTGAPASANFAGLIDASLASGVRNGYKFVFELGPKDACGHDTYSVRAEPMVSGVSKGEHFYMGSGRLTHNPDHQAGPRDEQLPVPPFM